MARLRLATYGDHVAAGRRAISPTELHLFAPEQYAAGLPFQPYEVDTPLTWLAGTELFTGEEILVPAQLVLFYWKLHPAEAAIGYTTSGGLVFHSDPLRALLYGLYENLERDAINLRWYRQLPPQRVSIDVEEFLRSSGELAKPRLSTMSMAAPRVLLNTLDIPLPVFTAVTVDRSRESKMLLAGGGAWASKAKALLQAIYEIGQMQIGYKLFPHAWDSIAPTSPVSDLTDFYYAPIFYGFPQNLGRLGWYVEGGQAIAWDDVPSVEAKRIEEEYETVTALLKGAKLNPIVFDFSSACPPGLFVKKVFVPQLTFAHIPSLPYFGHPRYCAAIDNIAPAGTVAELKPDPLPFP
jgi:ribosomal protein S12 methylthiotransferase accessory factor